MRPKRKQIMEIVMLCRDYGIVDCIGTLRPYTGEEAIEVIRMLKEQDADAIIDFIADRAFEISEKVKDAIERNIETCCVVDQFCESPANVTPLVPAEFVCFACGERVCGKCSSVYSYYNFGKQRLCNNCLAEYDGNDERVMALLRKQAGYRE